MPTAPRETMINCSSGLKYPMPHAEAELDYTQPIDWDALAMA